MNKFTYLINIAIVCYFAPIRAKHAWFLNKFKKQEFILISSRRLDTLPQLAVLQLKSIHNFRYQYHDGPNQLEYNHYITNGSPECTVMGDTVQISVKQVIRKPAVEDPFASQFENTGSRIYNQLERIKLFNKPSSESPLTARNEIFLFKGRRLPKLVARDSKIYIDSIEQGTSLIMDLDFSISHWANLEKREYDRHAFTPYVWKLDTLAVTLRNSLFYVDNRLQADHMSITAVQGSTLDLSPYNYQNVLLSIDSTTHLKAPYGLWKKLKIVK
jgi:hypothetical protein